MIISKISNYIGNEKARMENHINDVNTDLEKIFIAMSGRLRFGDGTDGEVGENISGQFQQFTTNATPNTEETIAHTLGSTPKGYIIFWQDKAGSLYQGPSTGTAWTSSNVYLKCSVASVTFNIFLVK